MSEQKLEIGSMVRFTTSNLEGTAGVVSRPVTSETKGHVLFHRAGHVAGIDVSVEEVDLADEATDGFAQLAYTLIKLGSHVIEKTLI